MRLYQDGEWFDTVPAGALYEHEFEGIVMQHKNDLFPGFRGARFDPKLATSLGTVQPDMILVDQDYRSLFVVEVELASHSLTRHVLPQIEKISAAQLTEQHAAWLCERERAFDAMRLRALFRDVPHSTVLLANAATPHWDDGLRSFPGVYRTVVEVFRSVHNRTILRVNGTQPEGPGALVTALTAGTGAFGRAYKVSVPSSVHDATTEIDTEMEGSRVRFRVKRLGADKFLFSLPAFDLPRGQAQLFRYADGSYKIEVIG